MPNGKTCGCDGLNTEFYKMFWSRIGVILHAAIVRAIELEQLHLSARKGIITLIPKKNPDLMVLKNWRPVTMLNVDYKILSKALANRMKKHLPEIIDADQTGFMAGRNIATNIRKVIEVSDYVKKQKIAAVVLSIDFKSCFDIIHQQSIFEALKYFQFGEYFIQLSRLLFTKFELCIQNNGFFSEFFPQESGIHQGCNSAPYYYLLCGQLVHNLFTNNPKIKGITIHGVEKLLSQFADDTDLFFKYETITLNETLTTLSVVESNLGLKVNYDKTSVYRMGSIADTDAKVYTLKPLNWTNDPINILGVTVSNDMVVQVQNYEPIFNQIQAVFTPWKKRNLTLSGKVLLINSLIASLFVYKMQALPLIDQKYIDHFNVMVKNFLWEDKKPKIPLSVLNNSRETGGLRLIDLSKRDYSLKAQWVRLIIDIEFFAQCASVALDNHDVLIWYCNISPQHVLRLFCGSFWRDVLFSWSKFNFFNPSSKAQVLQQIL